MSEVWLAIGVTAVVAAVLKAIGPAAVGGRELSPRATAVIAMLAPALLTGLIVADTFGAEGTLELDARIVGVAAAGVALALRAPMLVALAVAAVSTALVRAL
jgi:uncharacterized membrane protein